MKTKIKNKFTIIHSLPHILYNLKLEFYLHQIAIWFEDIVALSVILLFVFIETYLGIKK